MAEVSELLEDLREDSSRRRACICAATFVLGMAATLATTGATWRLQSVYALCLAFGLLGIFVLVWRPADLWFRLPRLIAWFLVVLLIFDWLTSGLIVKAEFPGPAILYLLGLAYMLAGSLVVALVCAWFERRQSRRRKELGNQVLE